MSFDAHSRERLEALGRTLPLPQPQPAAGAGSSPRATEKRHRVEVEENPEALFRELMQVSPDGSVPPHLLDRLKQLEGRRQPAAQVPAKGAAKGPAQAPAQPSPGRGGPRRGPGIDHGDLYTAFQQLLLEDESLE
ncbi:hypothetical protein [Synechococcus sp. CBW1108]|uniref:hypothetical protein n=1 Tax=Synechococcus sp. CBW1108 TaxID=1353147 RepID=UPI0018CFE0A2|nr:hypothetical protein [Synechococcus sp. CBW1108]QPN69481.1 hypothetical protein H8F27_13120 [Synechococcus sp. CBW1108]